MSDLDVWVAAAAGELGLRPGDVQSKAVLDIAREVAHQVLRPAAPLTAYLMGVAVGRGIDPADAAARISALALAWPEREAPKPVHEGPKPVHEGRKPVHEGPRPVHEGPKPEREGPKSGEGPKTARGPEDSVRKPEPSAQEPEPSAQEPEPSAQEPEPTA
jgi:hypothetical protein